MSADRPPINPRGLPHEKLLEQRRRYRHAPERARWWMLQVASCSEDLGEDGMCDCARTHFATLDALRHQLAATNAKIRRYRSYAQGMERAHRRALERAARLQRERDALKALLPPEAWRAAVAGDGHEEEA